VIPELADGNRSFVSMASPVGKALMNRRVGDTVTITIPRGTLEYEVRRIVTLTGDVLE
jgi:transcription elongation factor GreA